MLDTMMGRPSAILNVANLSNLSPGHGGQFRVYIDDELAHLGGSAVEVALAPPCSPDENRLDIPSRSNSSALRDRDG